MLNAYVHTKARGDTLALTHSLYIHIPTTDFEPELAHRFAQSCTRARRFVYTDRNLRADTHEPRFACECKANFFVAYGRL